MLNVSIIPILCGLLAAFSWGVADYFATKATRKINPVLTSIFVSLTTVIVSFFMFLIYPQHSVSWSMAGVGYAVGSGLLIGTGLLMFYHGLEVGPVSVVSPIGSAYPLLTTLVVVLLLHGHLTFSQVIGVVLVVLGIITTSGLLTAKKKRRLTTGVIYALLTFGFWGAGFALLGEAVAHLGWVKATFVDVVLEFVAILIVTSFFKEREKLKLSSLKILTNKYVLLIACIQLFGLIMFNVGLARGVSTAVITAISSSYPALTILLALKKLNEKAKFISLGGAFVTIAGIVMLSVR